MAIRRETTVRIEAAGRAHRRVLIAYAATIVAFTVLTFGFTTLWTSKVLVVLLIGGFLTIVVPRFGRVEFGTAGIHLDNRWSRRDVPWDQVRQVHVGKTVGPRPRIELRDGSTVEHTALSRLPTWSQDPDQRQRLAALLEQHDVALSD